VEKSTKHTIIGVTAIIVVMMGVFIGIYVASGVNPPHTVVVSESMQHSPSNNMHSQLGVIDAGDMILLRSKGGEGDMDIQSYVDGYKNGYSMFGSYGDVIIYDRGIANPVIHRAILWLELNDDGKTWSAPSLEGYPLDMWTCASNDYNHLSGNFTMKGLGYNHNVSASINLDLLIAGPSSGFLTMGDHNYGFDAGTSVAGNELVSYEKIKSVAWIEVPWVGSFKMILSGDVSKLDTLVPNTIPSLIAAILMFMFILFGISSLFDQRYYKKYKKEMYEDMNALPPSFPVEDKKE